ncbi:carboxypeptidase regulatory-like domain-containing protein [Gemmatimonadota bacterium]
MRSPLLHLIPVLLFAAQAPAAGQILRGQVVDEDRSPVSSAEVSLMSETGEVLRGVESDGEGNFRFEEVSSGSYLLRVVRLGYESMTTQPVLVEEGSTVEVELRVAVDAIPLEPLVVRQRSQTRRLDPLIQGFYERRETGIGHFIAREEIEERQASRLSDLLREVPGVWKFSCRPSIWLDGMLVRLVLDEVASPHEVEGIEIYLHAGEIPARYNPTGSMCGVILIWTR